MFKINTEQELYNFLKILSEESVKKSKKILKEDADPYSEYYLKKRSEEEKMFEQESEPEEPEAETPSDPAEPADTKASEPEADEPSESEGEESAEPQESFFASKDRLVDFVNDIRSAPSIKDSAVSDQIDSYYDRLSEEERNVLVFFLRELSKVMTGKASGADARDPSDPPLNIQFVSKEESVEEVEPDSDASDSEEGAKGEEPPDPAAAAGESKPESEEEEDTSAPIKVNESQDHRALRKKIRHLMS